MQKFLAFLCCILSLNIVAHSQSDDYYYSVLNMHDTSEVYSGTKAGTQAYFGDAFTPKGTFRALIIYAGFYTPGGVFDDDEDIDNWLYNSSDILHLSVPSYITNGSAINILFNDAAQLSDPQYANIVNLTRYYYDNSHGNFILLGDVFRDPTTNQPIRINIDPTGLGGSGYQWTGNSGANYRVLDKIKNQYTAYWNSIFTPYDNRDNNPDYAFDNSLYNEDSSPASADGIVDYVIIIWRYSTSWEIQPVIDDPLTTNFNECTKKWSGSEGGVAGLTNYNYNGLSVITGFTVTLGGLSAIGLTSFFPHEVAHQLYSGRHNFGANSTRGNFFYFPASGWGMMSSNSKIMLCSNSWESWLLGWNDLFTGSGHEPSNILGSYSLNSSGNYTLRDFATTGDAIRVKIPGTETYLWIENHQGLSDSETKPWAGANPSWSVSSTNSNIADFSKGIYMFTEDIASDRENYTITSFAALDKTNRIKPLNPQGNYDYLRTEYPKLDPNNPNKLDTRYSWGNPTYVFEKTLNNPICGTNPWFKYFDDFHRYDESSKLHISSPDYNIDMSRDFNSGSLEAEYIACETDGTNEYITNSCFGGRNTTASTLGQRSDAFEPGDELSISGIIPVLNNPEYDESTYKTGIYSLNGLKISIVSENLTTHEITVHISFNDYTLTQDKRWCGLIDLPDITSNTNSDLIIYEGVTLEIDKSGTPNRHTLTTDGDFINPTVFTIKSGSKLEIEEGAEIVVKNGSTLVLESGATLLVDNGGTLTIEESANFDYQGGTINLAGNNSLIDIAGNLSIAANAQFTFTGAGFIKFSNPGDDWTENITCGSGASIYLHGSGQSDKVLEVQQNTVRFPAMASLTFEDCKIEMGASKRMLATADYPITFDNVLLTSTSGSNNAHRSFYFYGQSNAVVQNSIFENGQYGLKGELNYYGAKLYIDNCEFRNNTYGLYLYDKGVDAEFCNFHDNSSHGVYCSNMSFTSDFYYCNFEDNNYGMYYQGSSSADLDVEACNVSSNTTDGIVCAGAYDLNLLCNTINDNRYGVITSSGTYVYANQNAYNNMSGNDTTIYLNYGSVSLLDGYNQLQATGNAYTVYGYTHGSCSPAPIISASHNRWSSVASTQPRSDIEYRLYVYGCFPSQSATLKDLTPAYTVCTLPDPENLILNAGSSEVMSENEAPLLSLGTYETASYPQMLEYLSSQCELAESATAYENLVSAYIDLITHCSNFSETEYTLLQDRAYGDLHRAISRFFVETGYDKTHAGLNQAIEAVIDMNWELLQQEQTSQIKQIEYSLDIALLDRMRGRYESAIEQLDGLIDDITDPIYLSEQAYAENWLCHIEAEKQLDDGSITIDEFATAIAQCDALYAPMENGDYYNESFGAEEQANPVAINIQPNPSQGVFSVQVNGAEGDGMIRITKSGGQIVYSQVYTGQALNISGFTKGEYTVYYIENQVVKASAWLIVE